MVSFHRRQVWFVVLSSSCSLLVLLTAGCAEESRRPDLGAYQYRDTRNLVKFVHDAARRLEQHGEASLDYFRRHRDLYKTPDTYLYIYDLKGTNVFHAGMPELEGKNLIDLTDIAGKKVGVLMLEALKDPRNPHAWIHYYWWEPESFYSVPKSSCHFKAVTPEGRAFCVGGGLNYPQEEKEFIRIAVDDAVDLINRAGPDALPRISDPASKFVYRDVRVFAFYGNGEIVISPVTTNSQTQIDLLDCVDQVGKKPFTDALHELESAGHSWQVFMAKTRYRRTLVKKCLYLRKTTLREETLYVGAVTDLPQPAWIE